MAKKPTKNQAQAKLRRKNKRPLLIAHRGGRAEESVKENSLEAFQAASKLGYEYLETDVVATKDKVLIVYHGSANRLQEARTGNVRRNKIENLSLIEVQSYFQKKGEKLLTLTELLDRFPDKSLSIDAKTDGAAKLITELLSQKPRKQTLSVTSFSLGRSTRLAKNLKGYEIGLCVHPRNARAFRIVADSRFKKLTKRGISIVHFPYKYVSKDLLRLAHKNNVQIWAWTVNNESDMVKMSEIGVDGIISDEARLLKQTVSVL